MLYLLSELGNNYYALFTFLVLFYILFIIFEILVINFAYENLDLFKKIEIFIVVAFVTLNLVFKLEIIFYATYYSILYGALLFFVGSSWLILLVGFLQGDFKVSDEFLAFIFSIYIGNCELILIGYTCSAIEEK
jgi:hypothetical protein